jgi:hypothetical protein
MGQIVGFQRWFGDNTGIIPKVSRFHNPVKVVAIVGLGGRVPGLGGRLRLD